VPIGRRKYQGRGNLRRRLVLVGPGLAKQTPCIVPSSPPSSARAAVSQASCTGAGSPPACRGQQSLSTSSSAPLSADCERPLAPTLSSMIRGDPRSPRAAPSTDSLVDDQGGIRARLERPLAPTLSSMIRGGSALASSGPCIFFFFFERVPSSSSASSPSSRLHGPLRQHTPAS
jgi:hypothetical protein